MQQPSVSLALSLSLLAGVALAAYVMPPARYEIVGTAHAGTPHDAAARLELRCEGYERLHLLLRSTREAETFRKSGGCEAALKSELGRQP